MNSLTQEEANERLNDEDNLVNKLEKFIRPSKVSREKNIPNPNGGRKPGQENLSDFERSILGTAATISGSTQAAKDFNVSKETAQKAKDGVTSNVTGEDNTREITVNTTARDRTKDNLENIADKGTAFLIKTLGLLDKSIDATTKPRELASIGRDVAKIVETALPKESIANGPGVVFQFYVPQQRSESEFEVIDIVSKNVQVDPQVPKKD